MRFPISVRRRLRPHTRRLRGDREDGARQERRGPTHRRGSRILLKKRPIFAFEFDGRRLDIGTKQDWMRANLILGLEQEPWRSAIEDVIREHPEGRRIARRVAAAGKPTGERGRK